MAPEDFDSLTRGLCRRRGAWSDADLLLAMEARARGCSMIETARAVGRTMEAVVERLIDIEIETDSADVSPHLNGTLPPLWWVDGLMRRGG